MKNIRISLFALATLLLFSGVTAFSQPTRTNFSNKNNGDVSGAVITLIKAKMESEGYLLLSDDHFTVEKGDSKYKSLTLRGGREYVFINVPAEDGFRDSDLFLRTEDGTLLKKDDDDGNISLVQWQEQISRTVKVWVKNYKSDRAGYEYGSRLLIYYK